MYTDISSAVKNNGHLTSYFNITRSVRQGCPISALLYILAAEPLARSFMKANEASHIKGIEIVGSSVESLIYQHADDTTITVTEEAAIEKSLELFSIYSAASGGKINYNKTELLALGAAQIGPTLARKIKVQSENIVVLGVCLGKNKLICEHSNWDSKVKDIKRLLNMWKLRKTTIKGRAMVIQALLMSKLWYMLNVQPMPQWAIDGIKTACIDFLWCGAHLVKYHTIIGQTSHGGLNLPDITMKKWAFRMKMINRYFENDSKLPWVAVFNYFLNQYKQLNLSQSFLFMKLPISAFNYMPVFFQEMILSWYECLKSATIEISHWNIIISQPLFHNPRIIIAEKSLSCDFFEECNVSKISDIIYEFIPGFLPTAAVIELIQSCEEDHDEIKIEKVHQILLQAIPQEWITVINTGNMKSELQISTELSIGLNSYTLGRQKSRLFYGLFRDKAALPPTSYTFWVQVFPTIDISKLWHVNGNIKPPDLTELDFRILHNSIFTMEKLYKIGKVETPLCPVFKAHNESLIHLFLDCTELHDF
jgi:hypothetical protein